MTDIQQSETEAAAAPDFPPITRQLFLDATKLIVGATESNVVSAGSIEVSAEVFQQAFPLVGKARFVSGQVALLPLPPAPPATIPVTLMRQRIEAKGLLDEFSTYLAQNPALMMKLLTLEGGNVDPTYDAIGKAFDDMALPASVRAYILAPASEGIGVP